ncbi:hypothetical protein METESE_29450 [Mesoterricola sediminis]|uniref:Uncharacterized protein n=1 Tax=Mesoterricola sediminis TaxID=2927980 RepID=A0AA48H1N1_9BACT|nr:hypothetical protein METESE_29450 [Mesoterricola sediminis]
MEAMGNTNQAEGLSQSLTRSQLGAHAWKQFRTVITYGRVPAAVWVRPNPQIGLPGVMVAPNKAAALSLIRSSQSSLPSKEVGNPLGGGAE